jgi:hypothetical protein
MPEESELDAKFTELLVIVFFFIFFIFFLGCEMFLVDYFPEWISSDLRFPPLMIDGVFFIIIYLRRCVAWLLCIHQCYRVYLYKDDVMMTFAPPSFGVCNVGPSLANFFFFFLVFCCCFESFSSSYSSPTKLIPLHRRYLSSLLIFKIRHTHSPFH